MTTPHQGDAGDRSGNGRSRRYRTRRSRDLDADSTPEPEFSDEEVSLEGHLCDDSAPRIDVALLKQKSMAELTAVGEALAIENASGMRKQDLLFAILKAETANEHHIYAEGVLETLPDGFGFLRAPDQNYFAGPDDIYVSPSQIRRFNLRTGDTVLGQIRPPKDGERYFALLKVDQINFERPGVSKQKILFDNLTPLYPDRRFRLESESGGLTGRTIDLVAPIGMGQRALITSPPKAGKTMILKDLANAIAENHPDVFLIVLLIDERPEEVTEMERKRAPAR